MMVTAGVDLASQAFHTAACVIEWYGGHATVTKLAVDVQDSAIAELISRADKVGIDIPLGWPMAFVDAVSLHSRNGSWPLNYSHADNSAYRYRRTDLAVRKMLKISPLSVSCDRIAIPAMRAAALLSKLPHRPPLDGSGVVVEVYPAVALARWEFTSRLYKRSENMESRQLLVESLMREGADWLIIPKADVNRCLSSDDALDAIVAALVARAAGMKLVEAIPENERAAALHEGWIAVPKPGTFARLPLEVLE
ncbi:MAG TPA: DUF429 domain-containing protein, partial [Acidimicrobiales bacterium]|nr:DUF429 domain-containing protein [Acidimicrobiales bacterium]